MSAFAGSGHAVGKALCEKCRFCCKSLFALAIKNSFGRRRDFRVKMWGTSSPEDKLTGDLGNVIEATSIGGRRSVFLQQENWRRAICDLPTISAISGQIPLQKCRACVSAFLLRPARSRKRLQLEFVGLQPRAAGRPWLHTCSQFRPLKLWPSCGAQTRRVCHECVRGDPRSPTVARSRSSRSRSRSSVIRQVAT